MKLFFRKSGEGFPLIILHGLFGMNDNWASLAKKYAAAGFTVYLPDLRNHGQSPHDDRFTIQAMAEDLAEFFDREQLARAHLAGHSLGGKVAMYFACLHPERVSRLVVADIAPRYYPPHHETVLAGIHAVNLESTASRSEAEKQMEKILPDAGVRQFLLKNLYWKEDPSNPSEKNLGWRFNLHGIEPNIENAGEGLPENFRYDGPCLFIRGERSEYITARDYNTITRHFPQAMVETIPKAGHWVHADNPDGFSAVFLKFLQQH
jgi:esterase